MAGLTGAERLWTVQAEGEVLLVGSAQPIAVPSGQLVTLQDVILNAPGTAGTTLRFRFLAPQIARNGGSIPPGTATEDMRVLCESFALPWLADLGPLPEQIVISLSDTAVPFGETAPEATQFFEAFSLRDGVCIWEAF
ncbi:DUF6497 family protein [Rhodobacter ferrooxidans]|uniref:Acetolactate synthase n=1 Tax=Rhodobacter ferrooxidans TaxID=371731 RepID=C8S1G4_9RHOB|nr:DUF6497 family protein [Rhodobacter sp. SW2]EEW25137.1 hypothetical protein Rsw2DRAFT_1892 [Rhodobacter sp. SW2]